MEQTDFESVLLGAQAGANWAWARIYSELAGTIKGYVRRLGAPEPDDLVGDVFLQLARNIGTFTGTEANFRSWVFTVAHHRVLDDRRRRARRPVQPAAQVPELDTVDDTTSKAALDSVTSDEVQQVIDLLVPDQREVLLLRIIGGLTVSEVAEAVGKSIGAVKALQRRGLAALQRIIEKQGVTL